MALELDLKLELDYQASYLWITDETGLYDVDNNPGGWGGDNPERNSIAYVIYSERQAIAGIESQTIVGGNVKYDQTWDNIADVVFQILPNNDGHMKNYVGVVPAYTTAAAEGAGLIDGNYFYNLDSNKLQKRVSGEFADTIDYANVFEAGSGALFTDNIEDMITMKLRQKAAAIYKTYAAARETCKDEQEARRDYEVIYFDIIGVDAAFYSGLLVEAQDKVESMITYYAVT